MPPEPEAAAARPFRLCPFPGEAPPGALHLEGQLTRQGPHLEVRYRLGGPLAELEIPPEAAVPQRRDGLWRGTCLECFLARPADPAYWEVNLSPAGHWNVYRLDGYRQGLAPEAACARPQMRLRRQPARLEVQVQLILPPPLAGAPELEVGVTAVIATRAGGLSHWALHHPGPEPDFHRREAFALRL